MPPNAALVKALEQTFPLYQPYQPASILGSSPTQPKAFFPGIYLSGLQPIDVLPGLRQNHLFSFAATIVHSSLIARLQVGR
jgi:hypothetical protein